MKRWVRFALPPAAVLALITGTLIGHAVQQPDPEEPSFLSPVSDADDGGSALAARLAGRGVTVDRQTGTPAALRAAVAAEDATLFVTAPQFVHPDYLRRLRIIPPSTRIVLVAPTGDALAQLGHYVPMAGPRWAAAAPEPGCAQPFAAGPAAVLRWQYLPNGDETFRCYADSVVEVDDDGPAVTMVGATDPFRNDRQGEHANAEFTTGLLARSSRVVWLDLHERERGPQQTRPTEDPGGEPEQVPRETEDGYAEDGPGGDSDQRPDGAADDEGPPQSSPDEDRNPLFEAFPPAFWATLLVLLAALLAMALAAARRLGTPVAEPLPTRVRAAETVRGLGGLYRRARARDASLATLQAAAVRRLAVHFDLPADSSVDQVSARVAAHTGQPEGDLRVLLGGGVEDTDEDLAAKATAVQLLVRQVTDEGTTR